MTKHLLKSFLILIFSVSFFTVLSQDNRAQYPLFIKNSYFSVNIGYINYPFTAAQAEPGFQVNSVQVPHLAVRFILLGYNINENLSAQLSYMRPVLWVRYRTPYQNILNGAVFMNVGGFTLKYKVPVSKKISLYGEGGMGLITRSGLSYNDSTPFLKEANFLNYLMGGSFQYHLNKKWDLTASGVYSPSNKTRKQPSTTFYSLGFQFNINALPEEKVKQNQNSKYIFPKQLIQVGYTTNAFGYGVNKFLAEGKIPVFWGGWAEVKNGFIIQYRRNVFHTKKVFSLDWGTSFSYYQSRKRKENFYALSVFPITRFTLLHTNPADFYFFYSVPGPSYLSKIHIDGANQGSHFTFQDLMGIGTYSGKTRSLNAEIRIGHYSNGNLFTLNQSVKVPLTFNLGYTF